jgi:hypothetical protein
MEQSSGYELLNNDYIRLININILLRLAILVVPRSHLRLIL